MTYKYGQYCPVARAAEILGDRWTLLIVRDLVVCGVHRFSDLERGLPGIPRALLAERLRRLQKAGIIERQPEPVGHKSGYELTQAGLELRPIIESMLFWGARWAFGEPDLDELNPTLLLWWMRDRVYTERLPQERVVVEFDFREESFGNYWLVMKPQDVSVCLSHPGFEPDMLVSADLGAFYKVWLGYISYSQAVYEGQIEIKALPMLARSFPTWFAWSPAADGVRKVETARSFQVSRAEEQGLIQTTFALSS
jgi:DNA-binding HxlR family transcriptional regulator